MVAESFLTPSAFKNGAVLTLCRVAQLDNQRLYSAFRL
jgi:hypothetical protein